jgi:hypothetical protein
MPTPRQQYRVGRDWQQPEEVFLNQDIGKMQATPTMIFLILKTGSFIGYTV